ncbi:hypothetical protein PS6_001118 [Mucor atramentarius]
MSINTNMPLVVDEETRTDVLDYFPVITNKEIYYQLLTQHIKYKHAQQNQAFQDDTSFLNEFSLKWRVPLTVQKRLEKVDTDWNKMPSTLHEMPNIYLQDLALFLDDSTSRLLYSKIDLSTWNWQEKSKCFPLIETTENRIPFSHLHHERQAKAADKTRKAKYSRRSVRKLALFDTSSSSTTTTVNKHNLTQPDYGREIIPTPTVIPTTAAAAAAAAAAAETARNRNSATTLYRSPGGTFLPHREIDDFIKQKKQVSFIKQEHDL